MIEIKILDKHGVELKNGDVIRYVSMTSYYQDEHFFRFQSGVAIKHAEYTIDAQSEVNEFGMFSMPMSHFDKPLLVDLFECEKDNQEEYEAVLMDISNSLNIEFTNESDLLEKISGFEVVK